MTTKSTAADFGKVVVLMGGDSAEREISLITGNNILTALQKNGVDAHGLDVKSDVVSKLLEMNPDRAFVALHGPRGEDGVIQGLLEYLNIPYTGSGVTASALTMDKAFTKWVWQCHNIPTPPFRVVDHLDEIIIAAQEFGLPLCIKPINDGSSVGVTKVLRMEQLSEAFKKAAQYSLKVIVEPWIEGAEYTIGILGDEALPVIEIRTPHTFYDFDAKYKVDSTNYICPSKLPPEKEQQLRAMSLKAFRSLGCKDWGRVDALADKQGNFWLLEINTIPGMTDHSLVPKAAKVLGIDFDELVMQILAFTLESKAHTARTSNLSLA